MITYLCLSGGIIMKPNVHESTMSHNIRRCRKYMKCWSGAHINVDKNSIFMVFLSYFLTTQGTNNEIIKLLIYFVKEKMGEDW